MTTDNHNRMKQNSKMWIFDLILIFVGILLDQWTKRLAMGLKNRPSIILIQNILELHYIENRGAAFGVLQGKRIYFIMIAAVVFIIIGWIIIKLPSESKYRKLHIALSLILAGAAGNTIDRTVRGYVVDFIYFKLIDFPVFNTADIYITVTTIWLALMILFIYKEEDFDFIRNKSGSGE